MDVVITGGTGMIGTALQTELRRRGHEPIVMTRSEVPPGAKDTVHWEPAAGTIDAAALEGVDAVVHLAGEGIGDKRWTDAQKRKIVESRTRGTTLLCEALASLDRPPAVLVSGSAVGYYGDRGDEVLTEESPPGDDFVSEVCTKWEAATHLASVAGIRVCTIRSGVVLDPDGGALGAQLLPFKLGIGGRIGSGEQWQSWISIHDEVSAICHLLDAAVAGPVNLVGPNPVRNREFASTLGRVLRRPTIIPTPIIAPALLYGRELVESLLLVSQRALPTVLLDSGFEFRHTHIEPALRAVLDRREEST